MTYEELALARGISTASAIRLVRRRKWQRQKANEGGVRVLVPEPEDKAPERLSDVVRQLDRIEAMSEGALWDAIRRADDAMAQSVRLLEQLADTREDAARLREQLEALRQAEAERQGRGRWARLRAAWRG